jgi:hypothetical protein
MSGTFRPNHHRLLNDYRYRRVGGAKHERHL